MRLLPDVHPRRERIELDIDPDREDFSGRVEIDLVLDEARTDLLVSARDLEISRGTLTTGGETLAVKIEKDDLHGVAHLALSHRAAAGPATLSLTFTGPFNKNLAGLYRVKSGDRYYAYTEFEAINARRAFPCFDEPAFKIPFEITLTVPVGLVAVANTPIVDETPSGQTKRVRFKPTRPLPSYLVAVAVGDFDVVTPPPLPPNEIRSRPLQVRGIATKGRGRDLAFALRAGGELLVMLERWFGTEFPYEKLDHFAIPESSIGAMENAGLITYREAELLIDEGKATEFQKLAVAVDLAHEMAHQWFGDLVTMAWWDDLWLNESFATVMETVMTSAWAKGNRYDLTQLREVQAAMATDELSTVTAIRSHPQTEDQIYGIDYNIVYPKGAQVISMFQQYLGEDRFRAGIRRYLAAHTDGNATMDDLMAALSAGGDDLTPTLRSFVEQPGMPLVSMSLHCEGGTPRLALKQSRQLPLGSTASRDVRWSIPVCVKSDGNDTPDCTLLSDTEGELRFKRKTCPAWVAPNPGAKGYYRWTLPSEGLRALLGKGYPHLSSAERLSLGSNLGAGFRSGSLAAADVLAALAPLAHDPEPAVAEEPADLIRVVHDFVVDAKDRPAVEAYFRTLYRPALARLGWKTGRDELARVQTFRAWLIRELIDDGGDREVLEKAAALGRAYLGRDGRLHPEVIDRNLIFVFLAAAGRLGSAELFDTMLERLGAVVEAPVRAALLHGLGSFTDPALAERARNLALDDHLHVDERLAIAFTQATIAPLRAGAWQWTDRNFEALAARLAEGFVASLPFLAHGCGDEDAKALEDSLATRIARYQGGSYGLGKAVEATRLCGAAVARHRQGAHDFFARTR